MKPILIVEDEAVMRESLRDWLSDIGYEVETAEAGEAALEAVEKQDFGVIVLDLRLPGKDGVEVLKEVRARRPQLKGIIMTAYPSVQTAVEAMKEGAVDYLTKPFEPNDLENIIRNVLGPVQVEIKPSAAVKEAVAEPVVTKPAKVAEVTTVTPEEVPAHLQKGKELFQARNYLAAQPVFEAILATSPGDIETRIWLRKTNEALAAPEAAEEEAAGEGRVKECLWAKMGMVSVRICTNDYDCITCEFDQIMQEKMASGTSPELEAAMERLKELPGCQRLCRYALKGDISYRVCSRLFQCATCEFGQMMEDALQQKLAKLAVRREALLKKEQQATA